MSLIAGLRSLFARKIQPGPRVNPSSRHNWRSMPMGMATFKGHIKKDKKLGRVQPTYEKPINYIRRINYSNNYSGKLTRVGISGKNMKEWAPRAQA